MATNIGISYLFGLLKMFLDSVKQLQVIVHIMLINVAYPAIATIFFGALMEILTFQFYDFSDVFNKWLHLDPDSDGNNPINS